MLDLLSLGASGFDAGLVDTTTMVVSLADAGDMLFAEGPMMKKQMKWFRK